jgi:hypothetical protein
VVLRGVAVDDVRGRPRDGRHHARWRHVPPVAANHASGGMVSQRRHAGSDRGLFWDCDCSTYILHHHRHRRESGHLDISEIVCGCWIRASLSWSSFRSTEVFPLFFIFTQVDSFIPLWEWDLPKKGKKKKAASSSTKSRANGGASAEEVDDSEYSRPQSRTARVEEVEDEDAPPLKRQ